MAEQTRHYHTGKIENHLNRDGLVAQYQILRQPIPIHIPARVRFHTERSGGTPVAHIRLRFGGRCRRIFDQPRTTHPASGSAGCCIPSMRRYGPSTASRSQNFPMALPGSLRWPSRGPYPAAKTPRVHIVGATTPLPVDGTNYDEDGALEKQMLKRKKRNREPGAKYRLKMSRGHPIPDRHAAASLTSSPTHQVRLLEEKDMLGCEIVGPKRTTRWCNIQDAKVWTWKSFTQAGKQPISHLVRRFYPDRMNC